MTPMEWAIWWSLLVLAIACSALCSGLEIGTYALNRVRLDLRAARSSPVDHEARILRQELARPARMLAVLLISNNIVNAIATQATAEILDGYGYSVLAITLINTLMLGPLLFIVGDAAPKEFFRLEADRLTPAFARSLRLLRYVLTGVGILPVVSYASHLFEKALRLPADAGLDARGRVAALLKEGAGHGVLSESQVTLLDRALTFRSITVADEMVPWDKVQVLPASGERSRLLDIVAGSSHTMFPMVDRAGRVLGVVRHLDLYSQTRKSPQELIRKVPTFLPDTPARSALAQLRAGKVRLGLVADEAGRPLGIVTAKDLVQPLTGELAVL